MGNAIWLIVALPSWFFPAVLMPLAGGPLTLIPAVGTVCLAVGTVLGALKRKAGLLLFFVPAVLSELFVAIAGLCRGQLQSDWTNWIGLGFLMTQLLLCGYLIWRTRGARIAASLLGVFCMAYATFAAFIAVMAFQDVWL